MPAEKRARVIVDSGHLSTLIASYNIHFAKYSQGRKQVTQIIPANVWKKVYADYLEVYPESELAERSLKERVRETLGELDTGTSNDKRSNVAVLQSEEVLKKIRLTDGHASRNVLGHRSHLINGNPTFLSPSSSPSIPSVKPVSKSALLENQVNTIVTISDTLIEASAKRDAILAVKLRMAKLRELKELRDLGIISEEELQEKAKTIMQLNVASPLCSKSFISAV